MVLDTVFRIAFYVFLGILIVMQVYFAYRIRRSKEQVGSDAPANDEPRMSVRASFRYSLFHTVFYISMLIWAGYGIWTGNLPWFLGIAAMIAAIGFVRKPLALARKYRPVAIRFSIDLSIQSASADSVTPEYIARILDEASVIKAIKGDLLKTEQIGYKERWRLGLITPERDRFDPRIYQLPRQEIIRRSLEDAGFRSSMLGKIPVERAAVLHGSTYFNIRFNNLVIAKGHSLRSYGLSTKTKAGEFTRIRDIEIHRASAGDRSRHLPHFLRESGFPLKERYADGDPLTTERGGTIVNDRGKIIVIYPEYFIQRRLVDDEGNLVYIGLDESLDYSATFGVDMQPSTSRLLIRCVSYNEHIPILRYRSFPYASDFMLPLLDTPMSASGWADLFIDTRGKARIFIAKEKPIAEWYEMMNRLKQLFYNELARKNYHFLGLTKDKTHLNEYLAKKQMILADYYIIQNWWLP